MRLKLGSTRDSLKRSIVLPSVAYFNLLFFFTRLAVGKVSGWRRVLVSGYGVTVDYCWHDIIQALWR